MSYDAEVLQKHVSMTMHGLLNMNANVNQHKRFAFLSTDLSEEVEMVQ